MSRPKLTARQQETIAYAALGLEQGAIGTRMGVTRNTVRASLLNARTKLGARTTTHAVALAVHYGYVTAEQLGLNPTEDA